MSRRSTITFAVLAGVAGIAVSAGVFGPNAVASIQTAAVPVTVSVDPASAEVLSGPCGMASLDVTITNHTSRARYVDVYVEPESPLTTSRDLLTTYVPAGGDVTAPVRVSAPSDAEGGTYDVTFDVGRVNETPTTVPVSVVPRPSGPGANLVLAGAASASSTHANFQVCGAVDGNTDSEDWSTSTGWNDATREVFPDNYDVGFDQPTQVSRVVLYTLDSTTYPAEEAGLRDWDVQVLGDNGTWTTVASVRENTIGTVTSTFDPVTTTSIRIVGSASNDAAYSRIVELEAYAEAQ